MSHCCSRSRRRSRCLSQSFEIRSEMPTFHLFSAHARYSSKSTFIPPIYHSNWPIFSFYQYTHFFCWAFFDPFSLLALFFVHIFSSVNVLAIVSSEKNNCNFNWLSGCCIFFFICLGFTHTSTYKHIHYSVAHSLTHSLDG